MSGVSVLIQCLLSSGDMHISEGVTLHDRCPLIKGFSMGWTGHYAEKVSR